MPDFLQELEKLEQEIANYRNKFQHSTEVLDDLAIVQAEFRGLSRQYEELKLESQQLREYINKEKASLTSLQTEAQSIIDKVSTTESALKEQITELECHTCENIKNSQGKIIQYLLDLEDEIEQKIQEKYSEGEAILRSIQTENDSKMNEVLSSHEKLSQSIIDWETKNSDTLASTQSTYHQKYTQIESNTDTKLQKFTSEVQEQIQSIENTIGSKISDKLKNLEERLQLIENGFNQIHENVEATKKLRLDFQEDRAQFQTTIEKVDQSLATLNKRSSETERAVYIVACAGCVFGVVLALLPFLVSGRQSINPQIQQPASVERSQ